MRIHVLVFVTLAPFLSSCGRCCYAAREDFTVDVVLQEAALNELFRHRSPIRDQLTCEDLCHLVYERDRGWQTAAIDACTHTLHEQSRVPADGVAARVKCRGEGVEHFCKGRRPLGHIEHSEFAGDELGAYLAHSAHLEAASVTAFTELADQLRRLGAPAPLVARCLVAAADEARHAAVLGGLARARGTRVTPPQQRACEASLVAIARHNAVEGCVYEAWAAVGAAWQAARAPDPELRAAFTPIAVDEAGHAQLAWDLHTWLIEQLTADERTTVLAAQHAAIAGLPQLAAAESGPPELGLPDVAVQVAMATRFAAGLAAAA